MEKSSAIDDFEFDTATAVLDEAYERKKESARQRNRQKTRESQEIGPLPPVKNPERRARALESLHFTCATYFPDRFYLPWAPFHFEYIADLERVVCDGGYQATALPRGGGKTNIAEVAMLWGRMKGIVEFGLLFGANEQKAKEILLSLRRAVETNDLLAEDFPEICYPIRKLEGTNQRRLYLNGQRLVMKITDKAIYLPEAAGTECRGGVLMALSLSSKGIRGLKHPTLDGRSVRPTHAILDDPQTDDTAASDKECDKREKIIKNTILGLAGPTQKLSVVMPCTIIRKTDLADRFLNRQKNPGWHGVCHGLLKSLPTNLELWQRYKEERTEGQIQDDHGARGNEFYKANEEALIAGGESNWPARFNVDELSSIQNFMNVWLENPDGAMAEFQNDPPDPFADGDDQLDIDTVCTRITGYDRSAIPPRVEYLSVGVDVQKPLLYWAVLGSEQETTSHVIDYGTWPKQAVSHFTLNTAQRTIQKAFPDRDQSAQLYAALEALEAELFGRTFRRGDGSEWRVGKLVVDARWETHTVFKWAAQSPNRDRIIPAQGLHRTQLNFDRLPPDGVKFGPTMDYRLMPPGNHPIRGVQLDSSAWISRVVKMLLTPVGATGAMTLFDAPPHRHKMIAEHLCAEYSTAKIDEKTKKRTVDWRLRPGVKDNHLLDSTKLALLGNFEQGLRESFDKKVVPQNNQYGFWEIQEGD